MCVALSFLFGYLLSTRGVYPQIGRAFEAPIGHKTLLYGHMELLTPFIAYFLKKNYSLRQNTLKILRAWERSLTSVPIRVYLCLIEVGTWLGKGSAKELWRFAGKRWPNAAQCSSSVRCEDNPTSGQTKKKMSRSTGLYGASDHEAPDTSGRDLRSFGPLCCRPDFVWLCLVLSWPYIRSNEEVDVRINWTLLCIWSWGTRRVWSRFEGF